MSKDVQTSSRYFVDYTSDGRGSSRPLFSNVEIGR